MYKYLDRADYFPRSLKEKRLVKSLLLPMFFLLVTHSAAQSPGPALNYDIAANPGASSVALGLPGFSGLDSLNLAKGIGRSGFYAGVLALNRGAGQLLDIETKGAGLLGIKGVFYSYPQLGGYLGITQTFSLAVRDVDLVGEVWFLVPSQRRAQSSYNFTAGGKSRRFWNNTEAAGGYIDAAVYFSWVPGWRRAGWSQINGLRYDYYSRRLKNPGSLEPVNPALPSSPSDVVEVSAGSWVPYVGLQSEFDIAGGHARFRSLVGLVISHLSHKETWDAIARTDEASITSYRSSFFFETFLDSRWHLSRHMDVGGFLKMGTIDEHAGGRYESSVGGGAILSVPCNLWYRKITYVFGVEVSAAFDFPYNVLSLR